MGRRNDIYTTKRWARLRLFVLLRDGGVCQMTPGCARPATTVDHVVPLCEGGDPWDINGLRAACPRCNYAAGGAMGARYRRTTVDQDAAFDWSPVAS